ncbi:MAG TPA: hypothetical protein PKC72_07395 [Chitinophagaceae bacterium]|nr:hypothetical protein [Chitinophagaceae bacterium]
MKRILFNTLVLFTALVCLTQVNAQDKEKNEPKFKKTKSYSKSYNLSGSDKVSLSNQFGEMKLVTWDKNEVKVDATITGKSDEEDRAQKILDHISIEDSKSGNTVSFKTKFADDKKVWNKDDKGKHYNEGMEINYVVYLPSGNALKAENQFGKMIVPDYRGEAELESKFGSLTTGKISNAKEVTVEFGKVDIGNIAGGKLNIKFSNGNVNKLSGNVNSNLEFSKVKLNIDNDAKSLDIHNSYSTVYLDLDKNLSASYDITTSHGNFSNESSFTIKKEGSDEKSYGPTFTNRYSGTSGSGSTKLKVNSSFGEIITGHNLQVDMSEKSKSKNKTRV